MHYLSSFCCYDLTFIFKSNIWFFLMLFLPCVNIHLTKIAELINYSVIPPLPLFIKRRCFLTCGGAPAGRCGVSGLRVCWGEPDPGGLSAVPRAARSQQRCSGHHTGGVCHAGGKRRLLVLFREIPTQTFWHVLLHSAQLPFQYNMIDTRKTLAVRPFSLLPPSL